MKETNLKSKKLKMEADVEGDYELVQECKKFLIYHNDTSLRSVYNPFSNRRIKKGSATYIQIYTQVKRYLENLDDEEFHSPLKIDTFHVDIVPPKEQKSIDKYLTKNVLESDRICNDWYKKVEEKIKKLSDSKEEVDENGGEFQLKYWKYDSPICGISDNELEIKQTKWILSNPELYSFLDYYKPEVFKNKYLMKHLFLRDINFKSFVESLQTACDIYLRKSYGSSYLSIPTEQMYPVMIIMLWIYQPFILNARKYMKKNKNKIVDYIQRKPNNTVKLNKQQICSYILGYFIRSTKIEDLDKIKMDYDSYFSTKLNESFTLMDVEHIVSRGHFRLLLTDFLSNRIRPYRYTPVKYGCLENFDKIVEYLDKPPRSVEDSKEEVEE